MSVPVAKLINKYRHQLLEVEVNIMGTLRMGDKQNNVSDARIVVEKFKMKDQEGKIHLYTGNMQSEIDALDKNAEHHIINDDTNVKDFNSIFEQSYI
ncbi:hypothetical protein AL503_002400 [Staphylococcus haemolyticus]|uniref:Uncharacterized protein n=1 Tax=Staphylococcus haemolyticus TaxID=1283 RepID=A0A2K0AX88_STAHA|nr:hypothetical protein AL503_002400 [Staphylococcus haemolyticus]